jgi:ATP-dependent DNA helicase DinG
MQPADSGEFGQLVYRIKAESLPNFWDDLMVMEENIYLLLGEVIKQVERIVNTFKEHEEEQALVAAATDLSGTLKDMQRIRDHLHFFVQRTDPNFIYWLEASFTYKAKSIQFVGVPIDVSPMLREHFFNVKDSVIMTSATLSVDKKFDYTCEQFGLDPKNDHVRTVMLPSPFHYRRQALVVIPRDFPTLKGASGDAYFVACLIQSVRDVAIQTNGRMLILFTSNRMLRQVHPDLKEQLHPYGIQVLGQGVDSNNRSKLVKLFQDQPQSVLLGTSSFWEGVDIPGDALTALVIVRLPFQPPTHPVVEAKSEYLKQSGKNPFLKLSIPQAVIRFKQGFGRLVRTANDRGIVIVYDTRLLDSYYGKYFLYSLPGPKIEHLKTENLVSRIKQWMEGEDSIEENEYI